MSVSWAKCWSVIWEIPDYWVYLGFTLAFIPLGAIGGTFTSAVMPDICDIDELESGERREGLFVTIPFTIARGVTG